MAIQPGPSVPEPRNSAGVSGVTVSHNGPLSARRLMPCQKNWVRFSDSVDGGMQILQLIRPPLTNPILMMVETERF